jgi:hypothetical protein
MPDIAASLTDAVLTKRCCSCREELPTAMFYKETGKKDGLQSKCSKCTVKHHRKYEQQNPRKIIISNMLRNAKYRSESKNLDFNINKEYMLLFAVSHCPVLGTPLEWSCRRGSVGGGLPNSPSLDRIDPGKGYVKGNVWIISHRANTIKNNATHEELKLVTKAVGEAIVRSLEF